MRRRTGQAARRRLTHHNRLPLERACGIYYIPAMNIGCLFGRHHPSLSSIARRHGALHAICEHCARPLEKHANGRWAASKPVYEIKDRAV